MENFEENAILHIFPTQGVEWGISKVSAPQLHLNGHLTLGIPYSSAINPTQNRLISDVLVRYQINIDYLLVKRV
jgi:hypothetical protein